MKTTANNFGCRLLIAFAFAAALGNGTHAMESQGHRPMDWTYSPPTTDEPAKLAYGVEDTDDVDWVLWCDPVHASVLVTPVQDEIGPLSTLEITSGAISMRLGFEDSQAIGQFARLPIRSRLLTAFRQSGSVRFALNGANWVNAKSTSRNGRMAIRSFFKECVR
jgi:hypothetical protein